MQTLRHLRRSRSLRPRNPADYRTVLWVALAIGVAALQYAWPQTIFFALPFSLYLGIACGVIAHNHNHRPTFDDRWANNVFGHVLTFFYGYPTLMWIPTHNNNHHRFLNRRGDASITWRYTNRHNLYVALTYFFISAYFQSEPIQRYIRRAKLSNRHLYGRIILQYALWIGYIGGTLALALSLHPWRTALFVWVLATFVPAFTSLFIITFFNYIQHVHTDSWSKYDHSRNFTGPIFNFLFFNNGFHTAHHDHPGLHWSALPAAHALIADSIAPQLNETNLAWYLFRQYFVALIWPQYATRQLGQEPSEVVTAEPDTRGAAAGSTRAERALGARRNPGDCAHKRIDFTSGANRRALRTLSWAHNSAARRRRRTGRAAIDQHPLNQPALNAQLALDVALQIMIFHQNLMVLGFDHVADRDDPHQFISFHHRQVTNAVIRHDAHDVLDRIRWRSGEQIFFVGHVFSDHQLIERSPTIGAARRMSRSVMMPIIFGLLSSLSLTTSDPQRF